jgi:hypothetical protein
MKKNHKIILAALAGNLALTALIHLVTGSADVWWTFVSLVAVFVPIMAGDVIREKNRRS